MRDFTIALVQQKSPVRQKGQNLEAALAWMRKAARKGAQLVVFPELNITGHAGHPGEDHRDGAAGRATAYPWRANGPEYGGCGCQERDPGQVRG